MSLSTISMLGPTPVLPALVPLVKDADGVVRVGHTRVTLETIYYVFLEGATPEETLLRYPSLNLADIYAIFSYCMTFPDDVAEYVQAQNEQAAAVRRANQARFPTQSLRERLLARRIDHTTRN